MYETIIKESLHVSFMKLWKIKVWIQYTVFNQAIKYQKGGAFEWNFPSNPVLSLVQITVMWSNTGHWLGEKRNDSTGVFKGEGGHWEPWNFKV